MTTDVEFRIAFCARTRALRRAQRLTMAEMAKELGVGVEAYRSYETRVMLPHHLVEKFCARTGVAIETLFTGLRPVLRDRE